ncbi:MAG: diguanylate cyclase [Deltaproteobacteria bacterium]|nr:diguanylate cyclase [Deltaproteobacteria bacterium]
MDIAGNGRRTSAGRRSGSFSASTFQRFLLIVLLLISLVLVSIFWGFYLRTTTLIRNQLIDQGRAFFREIVLNRKWVASYGGVYVLMRPGMKVNPFLEKIPGIRAVIHDRQGNALTLKNPALVTRELSELAVKDGLFAFHITSLKLFNPANKADAWEKKALISFENGVHETYAFRRNGAKEVFRYMAPLFINKACMRCHAIMGYHVGDVRGGISVSIPADEEAKAIVRNRWLLMMTAVGVIVLFAFVFILLSTCLGGRLRRAEEKLVKAATLDFLTGMINRREGLHRLKAEMVKHKRLRRPLSAAMLDLDFFKYINDSHGHDAGDMVLQELAQLVPLIVRGYDFCCRYGGEEFLLVMPETNTAHAGDIMERLRLAVEQHIFPWEGAALPVTISIGVAQMKEHEDTGTMLKRMDQALYEAKESGRNLVAVSAS